MSEAVEIVKKKIYEKLSDLDSEYERRIKIEDKDILFQDAFNSDIPLEAKYLYWQMHELKELKISSVKDCLKKSNIIYLKKDFYLGSTTPQDFSLSLQLWHSDVFYVFGHVIIDDNTTLLHGVSKTINPRGTFYFDFITEVIENDYVENLQFVSFKEFTEKDELRRVVRDTDSFENMPFLWFQLYVYPKKILVKDYRPFFPMEDF